MRLGFLSIHGSVLSLTWVLHLSTAFSPPSHPRNFIQKFGSREKTSFSVGFLIHFLVCRWSARKEIRTGRAGEENGSGNGLEDLVTFCELRALFLCDMIRVGVVSPPVGSGDGIFLSTPVPPWTTGTVSSQPPPLPHPCEWWESGPCL